MRWTGLKRSKNSPAMPKHKPIDAVCSVALSLDLIGDRWTMLIIRDAFYGLSRFQDFQQSIGLAKNVLTARLQKLVEGGILATEPVGDGGWLSYQLTPKGHALLPTLLALLQWGDQWVNQPDKIPIRVLERSTKSAIEPIVIRGASGKALAMPDLALQAGPGANLPAAEHHRAVFTKAKLRTSKKS
jgi:DNA-binding HxlR family transcriptional regulator